MKNFMLDFRIHCLLLFTLTLSGCGFQLRAPDPVAFKSIHLSGKTLIDRSLKTSLTRQGVEFVDDAGLADVRLELINEESEKRILTLSGTGRVREYELYYRVFYRTKRNDEATWTAPLVMESRRDYIYDDGTLLAKQAEERRLVEAMQKDVADGILRRLSALKKAQ